MGEVLAQLSVLPTALSPLLNEDVPTLVANLQEKSPPWLAKIFNENTTTVQQFFEEQRKLVVVWIQSQARGSIRTIRSFFTGASQAFLILVMSGFLISSYTSIEKSFITLFPKRNREFVDDLLKKLDVSVGGYIRAKVVEAIIVGIITFIAISFMGVPKAIGLSFIATVLNPVPYLGPLMATIPIVLSALTISWQKAIIALLVMGLIQILDGNILQPILLAQSVKVHPVTVLVALLIGASLLGVWGVVLAIPVAAFLQRLAPAMEVFRAEGFAPFRDAWQQRDAWAGQPVRVVSGDQQQLGRAAGVSARGALLLQQEQGVQEVSGGEVSLRLNDAT